MTFTLEDMHTVLRAARFASLKHVGQKRKGVAAEPYLNHLIEVAELISLSLTAPDANLIPAAFLHDTLEDTHTSKQELMESFGADITGLVCEVTDDKSLPNDERKRARSPIYAPSCSRRRRIGIRAANRNISFGPGA